MEIRRVRHNWAEKARFSLSRPNGAGEYVFLHFNNAVELVFHGRKHMAKPGAVIIFAPQTGHLLLSPGPLLHDWMHITGPVDEALAAVGLAADTLYQPACGAVITQAVAGLETEFFAQRKYWRLYQQAALTELWIALAYDVSGEQPPRLERETADRLRELRAGMLLRPWEKWTVDTMARSLNISASRLYALYRRMYAISPNRDLILIRIERAKIMLEQGETVAKTAQETGYASVNHFIRQFRQEAGISPGQYGHGRRT
ncbi:MAG TPA: AraC family transcriptional regulator [Candidatus Limiplasma sp.]|nr:AraC family transcriptional regulator [Candidatus Limiplasma sp.]